MSKHTKHLMRRDVLKATGGGALINGLAGCITGAQTRSEAGNEASSQAGDACKPEPALQGQIPLEVQLNGGNADGYCRNVSLVGQNTIKDRGANIDLARYGDFAYVSVGGLEATINDDPQRVPDDPLWGTAVIDASAPQDPQVTTILQSPANLNAIGAFAANEKRDLLAVAGGTKLLELHDLSDPADPKLIASADNKFVAHGLTFAPDGKTVYINRDHEADPSISAFDVSDPKNPELIATHPNEPATPHNMDISHDGKRLYFGIGDSGDTLGGIGVVDVSEIQSRQSNPQFKTMGFVRRRAHSHGGMTFRKDGRRYYLTQEEFESTGKTEPGGCPYGHARVWDVTDGWSPRQVGEFKLEVNNSENCKFTQNDSAGRPGIAADAFYSAHYNGIEREQNPNLSFWTWFASGLRVADIRDVEHPTEIAYYIPPPNPNSKFREHTLWGPVDGPANDKNVDISVSDVIYRPKKGHIWFVSSENGFQILELTEGAKHIPR